MQASPCPMCGGFTRVEITPNYFECKTQVAYTVPQQRWQDRPDPLSPVGMRSDPVFWEETRYRTCGHKFQTGAVDGRGQICYDGCGLYAIGHCSTCGKPASSRHSRFIAGRLACDACIHEAEAPLRAHGQEKAEQWRSMLAAAATNEQSTTARITGLPPATLADLAAYFESGPDAVDPATWSLRTGRRLDPVPWQAAAEALVQAGIAPHTVPAGGEWTRKRGVKQFKPVHEHGYFLDRNERLLLTTDGRLHTHLPDNTSRNLDPFATRSALWFLAVCARYRKGSPTIEAQRRAPRSAGDSIEGRDWEKLFAGSPAEPVPTPPVARPAVPVTADASRQSAQRARALAEQREGQAVEATLNQIRELVPRVLSLLEEAGRPGVQLRSTERKRLVGYSKKSEPAYFLTQYTYYSIDTNVQGTIHLLTDGMFLTGNNNPMPLEDPRVVERRAAILSALEDYESRLA